MIIFDVCNKVLTTQTLITYAKKLIINCLAGILLPVALIGCSNESQEPKNPNGNENVSTEVSNSQEVVELTRDEAAVAEQTQGFAINLLRTVAADNDMAVVSPLSLSATLGQLANGAGGKTLNEILVMLGYAENDLSVLNSFHQKAVCNMLHSDPEVTIAYANAIWSNPSNTMLKESFRQSLAQYYSTECFEVPTHGLNESVNSWVNQQTNGLIPAILSAPVENYNFMIANALRFKGNWTVPFEENYTNSGDFLNQDGSVAVVKFMNSPASEFKLYSDSQFQLASLPFGNGGFEFHIILPDGDLNQLLNQFTPEQWRNAQAKASLVNLPIKLPKFDFQKKSDMLQTLESLGMRLAKDPVSADFSGMAVTNPGALTSAFQSINFSIDENGCEAASVSGVSNIETSAGEAGNGFVFDVNRPFIFMVTEQHSNSIILAGVVKAFEN